MTREPRPDGKIFEVANLPTRFEAELAISFLESADIQAMGKFGDASGSGPHIALIDGFRVCVFDEDVDAAREILAAMAGADADSDASVSPGDATEL